MRLSEYELRRRRIAEAAAELFLARGFDAVSTAEVAVAAGVAEKTVFNHFPRKDDLVFRRFDEVVASFEVMLRERDRRRPLTALLLADIRGRLLADDVPAEISAVARIVDASPTLARRQLDLFEEHARVLERVLTEEHPDARRGGLLRAVSVALVGVHWAVLTERGSALARGVDVGTANRDAVHAAERAYAFIDLAGLEGDATG